MIIGIDISSIPYGTGVSNYTLNLVKNLLEIDTKNTYKLFFSSLRLPLSKEFKDLPIYSYKIPISILEFFWNRLQVFPIEYFIGKCDIFHTSDWTQPPTIKAKTITTVHDLAPFINHSWSHPKIISAHQRKLFLASNKCTGFICVSQNTKNDLLRFFPRIDPRKITIIPEAAEDKYADFLKLPPVTQKKQILQIKKKYHLDNYFLAQGTREPRKNLARLIMAFPKNSKFQLAIAGKYGWGEDINSPSSVKILGYIPEEDMVPLLAGAYCLIYPSLYEGFGLPVLKAMSLGIPVITSNTSSLPEITKNCAILINPESTEDIKQAIVRIANSETLYEKLSKKSLLQSKKFSWTKTAHDTLAFYEKIQDQ